MQRTADGIVEVISETRGWSDCFGRQRRAPLLDKDVAIRRDPGGAFVGAREFAAAIVLHHHRADHVDLPAPRVKVRERPVYSIDELIPLGAAVWQPVCDKPFTRRLQWLFLRVAIPNQSGRR